MKNSESLTRVEDLRALVDKMKVRKEVLEKDIEKYTISIDDSEKSLKGFIDARFVLTEVAELTQKKFKGFVESVMTKAINAVFDRPFKFILKYETKANKTYAQPLVQDGDHEPQIPDEDMGVGILDLISAAFRFVLWKLENPKSRNVMWLDEPMRDIGKGKLLNRAADFLREISTRLKFQLIINTHEPELARAADRTFYVTHNGEHSVVSTRTGGGKIPVPPTLPVRATKKKRTKVKF